MIQLKSAREIETMAAGGRILAATHQHIKPALVPGATTAQIDAMVESFIRSHAGATPSFKGLYGFPASACISLNEEIVHGIPSPRRVLKDGDIITVDIGVYYGGFHTDSAWTYAVGNISELHSWKKLCAPNPPPTDIRNTWMIATVSVSGKIASSAMPIT